MYVEEKTSSAGRQSSLPCVTEPLPHRSLSKEIKPHPSNPESSKPTIKQYAKLFMFMSSPCNKVECQASPEDDTDPPSHPPFKPLAFYRCGCLEFIKADDLLQYGLEQRAPTSTSHHESPAVTPDAEISFEGKKSYLVSVQGEFYLGSSGLFGTLAPRTTDALPQSSGQPRVQRQGKPADVDKSLEYRILDNSEKFKSCSTANATPKHSDPLPLQRPCQVREQRQHSHSQLHQHQHQLPVQEMLGHPHSHLYEHPDPKNPPPLGYRTSEDPDNFIHYSQSTATRKHSDPAPQQHQSTPSNLSRLSRHRTSNPRDDYEGETRSHGSADRDQRQENHSQETGCNTSHPRKDEGDRERRSQEAAPGEPKASRATVEEETRAKEPEAQRNVERRPRKEQGRLQMEEEKPPAEKEKEKEKEKENRDPDNHDHHPEPALQREQSSEDASSPPKLKFNIVPSFRRKEESLNSRSISRSSHGRRSHRSSSASQGKNDRDYEIYYMENGIEVQHETHSRSRKSKR